ncbi:hypothetical protein B0H66DRAFT_606070 [Apodospora peruviana]|uniref:Uncharacterized protein n=1 Tax=Apodospora peruviana TaxID=516989 RepID=A0AAE0M118_9PEZI|nr:hypothetical protein B0H66DRAFT_606070 [Apodospora peruviana]
MHFFKLVSIIVAGVTVSVQATPISDTTNFLCPDQEANISADDTNQKRQQSLSFTVWIWQPNCGGQSYTWTGPVLSRCYSYRDPGGYGQDILVLEIQSRELHRQVLHAVVRVWRESERLAYFQA